MSTMAGLRRTSRQTRDNYTSFGRDYIAETLGWSRSRLDSWLLSTKVHPHLVFWHSTCIDRVPRCNDGIRWINTGYFKGETNLEEDILLLCLEEGNDGSDMDSNGAACVKYNDITARTHKWTTVELWARSTWRIVQDNCSKGDIFEKVVINHPAAAYGIVFDILCIAFHNIVWVGPESVWATIINSACTPIMAKTPVTNSIDTSTIVAGQIAMDVDPNALIDDEEDDENYVKELLINDETFSEYEDSDIASASDFESESEVPQTPKRDRKRPGRKASPPEPTAPKKTMHGTKRAHSKGDDNENSPSKKVKKWTQSLLVTKPLPQGSDVMVEYRDEGGQPVSKHRAGGTVWVAGVQRKVEGELIELGEDTVLVLSSAKS